MVGVTAAPSPWSQAKIATRSTAAINGLVPGKRYAFRSALQPPNVFAHAAESP